MVLEAVVVAVINSSSNARLTVLKSAALLLPGMLSLAHAEISPEDISIDTNFSRYAEGAGRMKVDIYQSAGSLTVNDQLSFKINGVKDVVTGASPVGPAKPVTQVKGLFGTYNIATPNCKGPSRDGLTQCMSGASISDVRDEIDLNTTYRISSVSTLDVDVGRSSENDYESNFFNLNHRWEFNNKLTTLSTGYAYASDQVWEMVKLDNGSKVRSSANGGNKESHQGIIGLTQILDKDSLLQANLTYSYSGGYLSDPYKYTYAPWATGNDYTYQYFVHDARPGSRNQVGLLVRYVRNFSALNAAALHVDYRYYADTWGVDSHTFEVTWLQPIVDNWQFRPRIRYYSQSAADFYQMFYDAPSANGYYSSDYRLANFGAISGGVQLTKQFFDKVRIAAGVDFYQREKAYGFSGGAGTSLDNLSFSIYSVSVNVKF